jgi:hypothetical protein
MTSYGTLLGPYHHDWLQRQLVRPFYFTDNERLPQYATEAVLRARAAELPAVTTLFGWGAESVTQDARGVTAAERSGGTERRNGAAERSGGTERRRAPYDQRALRGRLRRRAVHGAGAGRHHADALGPRAADGKAPCRRAPRQKHRGSACR